MIPEKIIWGSRGFLNPGVGKGPGVQEGKSACGARAILSNQFRSLLTRPCSKVDLIGQFS